MPEDQYPLIFIQNVDERLDYTSPQSGGGRPRVPDRQRNTHGTRIQGRLENIWREFQLIRSQRQAVSAATSQGFYIEFRSSAGFDLVTKSLENIRQGVRLLNVRTIEENDQTITLATVYIPAGKENYFISKLEEYIHTDTAGGNPKNQPLVNSIEDIKLAIFESFWSDVTELIPEDDPEWCEIWLRSENDETTLAQIGDACQALGIIKEEGHIAFPERLVILVFADREQLTELFLISDRIAEYRKARETVRFFIDLNNFEQTEWLEDLLARVNFNQDSNTSICILDTGINNGHRLISPVLADSDMHSYNDEWGVQDHNGHGTNMCGIAIYGDLGEVLQNNEGVEVNHIIESAKILPPTGSNDPKLYGYITEQVISRAEIEAPDRNRVICMAITTDSFDQGKPSSWSGAIDNLASGAEDDNKRLIVLAAGNVDPGWEDYPANNLITSIHSPGQAWNALTVGAYTRLTDITDPNLDGFRPIAPRNGLSPFSSTSLTWEQTRWPIKPEVVFEGGNAAFDNNDLSTQCDDLSVLSTHFQPGTAQFEAFCMTSAATAQAAWMAAQIEAKYPDAWPETIRGLIVHSAEWTDTMRTQFFTGETERKKYRNLVRTCGYGVPSLDKALYCTNNSLVLVSQEELQPFDRKETGSGYRTKDMHFYDLPWPREALLELGNTPVKMRVTLSYFIEPGPGEIGWKDRYRYRSHGLKFDVNTQAESRDQFVARVNRLARDEENEGDSVNDSGRWAIGSQNRNLGSVHSDFIEGTAADIATCNFIGVFPVIGWWRERSHLNKWNKSTRYSLIVSIETPSEEVDLYTPVAVELQIPVAIQT